MVREKTLEKYSKIKKLKKQGYSIRFIKKECKCSDDTINKALAYVPNVPKKIRTSYPNPIGIQSDKTNNHYNVPNKRRTIKDKKGTFDLTMAVILKSIIKKVSKQYWNKSKEDIADIEKFEEYMSKRTGIEFNFVLTRRLVEELKKVNEEIGKLNGGN